LIFLWNKCELGIFLIEIFDKLLRFLYFVDVPYYLKYGTSFRITKAVKL
jgi:hypothetical protein